jgi:hypothetical protein
MTPRSWSENFRGRGNHLDGKPFENQSANDSPAWPANRAQFCVIKLTTNMLYF